ncbi:MAG: DUF6798 domain-containing protein [Blastocatellia bacterium]
MADRKMNIAPERSYFSVSHFSVSESFLALPSIIAAAMLLAAFNGGISIGASNHAGLLPVVRRILDPNYLPGDFNIQLRLYHHRTFAYLLAGLSAVLGESRGVVVLHAAGALLMAASLWFLCRTLRLSILGFFAATLFLASGFLWTGYGLEENSFIGIVEVQPPLFAHSFVLLTLALIIRERWRWAAVCVGMAVFFHLQIGVIATLMVAPFYAAKLRSFGLREIIRLALCYLIPASFAVVHLFQMIGRGLLRPSSQLYSLPYYIDFRHPHHFELMSAAHGIWVAVHVVTSTAIWWWLRRSGHEAARSVGVLACACWMLIALAIVHFTDYYLVQHDRIANLQMIRLSPLITVLGSLSLILLVQIHAERSVMRWIASTVAAGLLLISMGYGLFQATRPDAPFLFGIRHYSEKGNNWVKMCNWIRENGPRDSVYLTPPAEVGFTVLTDRSNVVEFKINPDGALQMAEWFERLRDLTGDNLPGERGLENRRPLNKAYGSLSAEQLVAVGRKYNARYAIVPKDSNVNFEVLHEVGRLRLINLGAHAARVR